MKRVQIDVDYAILRSEVISGGGFEKMMPGIVADLRETASRRAREVNGVIVPTIQPDLVVNEAIDPMSGEDCFVFGTRWTVDVPESAHIVPER